MEITKMIKIETLIKELRKYSNEQAANITLKLLAERKITYTDYLFVIGKLGFEKPYDIEQAIKQIDESLFVRRKLKISNLKDMNFLEVRHFFKNKLERGLKLNDLKTELLHLWEEGKINGFDYRFIIDALEEEIDICFLKKADFVGRYNY